LNDLPPFTLTAHDLLTKNAARRLANLIDEIPVGHVAGATFSCPPADGSAVVFVLSFASRPDVDVWHARTDCPAPSNRKITALVTIHASEVASGIADSGGEAWRVGNSRGSAEPTVSCSQRSTGTGRADHARRLLGVARLPSVAHRGKSATLN
jgi:hypothetical protein